MVGFVLHRSKSTDLIRQGSDVSTHLEIRPIRLRPMRYTSDARGSSETSTVGSYCMADPPGILVLADDGRIRTASVEVY